MKCADLQYFYNNKSSEQNYLSPKAGQWQMAEAKILQVKPNLETCLSLTTSSYRTKSDFNMVLVFEMKETSFIDKSIKYNLPTGHQI